MPPRSQQTPFGNRLAIPEPKQPDSTNNAPSRKPHLTCSFVYFQLHHIVVLRLSGDACVCREPDAARRATGKVLAEVLTPRRLAAAKRCQRNLRYPAAKGNNTNGPGTEIDAQRKATTVSPSHTFARNRCMTPADSLHCPRGFAAQPEPISHPGVAVLHPPRCRRSNRRERGALLEDVFAANLGDVRRSGNTGATTGPKAANFDQQRPIAIRSDFPGISTKNNSYHHCPIRLNFDFHGGSTGSNPVGGTKKTFTPRFVRVWPFSGLKVAIRAQISVVVGFRYACPLTPNGS